MYFQKLCPNFHKLHSAFYLFINHITLKSWNRSKECRSVLNGGLAYCPYVCQPDTAYQRSDAGGNSQRPDDLDTPILVICAVFWIYNVIIDVALSHHQSRCIAVTRYVLVVYNVCPSMPIYHFASLFHSTTISNNLSHKGKSRVLLWQCRIYHHLLNNQGFKFSNGMLGLQDVCHWT